MKVTKEDIVNFNELYLKLKTYAAVARQTGFSASTVSKYIIKGYVPQSQIEKKNFTLSQIPEEVEYNIVDKQTYLTLSTEEYEQIKELWKELLV